MTKVRTPLMSFDARGKVAKALVFSSHKGQPLAREYVRPNDPETAPQVTQRSYFQTALNAWRNYLTDSDVRAAWNIAAARDQRPLSGYNLAMASMLRIVPAGDPASYDHQPRAGGGQVVIFHVLNIFDGGDAAEAGNFDLYTGPDPDHLLLDSSLPIFHGDLVSTDQGDPGDVVFAQIRKDGQPRSGIQRFVLLA